MMTTIKFTNHTLNASIIIYVNKKSLYLDKGETKIIEVSENHAVIKASIDKQHKISIKWLNILLTEAINTDSRNIIYCDYNCTFSLQKEEYEFVFSENNYRVNDSVKLSSLCNEAPIEPEFVESYSVSGLKKCKIKHAALQLTFLSGLPLVIAGVLYSFFDFHIEVLLAVVILFLIGTLPSLKCIKKFNASLKNANQLLLTSMQNRCDYDRIEAVANSIVKDENAKGTAKGIAKVIKYFINSI